MSIQFNSRPAAGDGVPRPGSKVTLSRLSQQHTLPLGPLTLFPLCLPDRTSRLRTRRASAQHLQPGHRAAPNFPDHPGRDSSAAPGLLLLPSPHRAGLGARPPALRHGGARRDPGPEAAFSPLHHCPACRPAASPQLPAHWGPFVPTAAAPPRPGPTSLDHLRRVQPARRRCPLLLPLVPLPAGGAEELRPPRSHLPGSLPAPLSRDATGLPTPRCAKSPDCARGQTRLALPQPRPSLPGRRRDRRQRRGALTGSSQGLSPALPGASAPATQRLHLLSGRSSLPLPRSAPDTAPSGMPAPPGPGPAGSRGRHSVAEAVGSARPAARLPPAQGVAAAAVSLPLCSAAARGGADSCRRRSPGPGGRFTSAPPCLPAAPHAPGPPRRLLAVSLHPQSTTGGSSSRSSGRRPGNSSAAQARGAPTGSGSAEPGEGAGRGRGGAGRGSGAGPGRRAQPEDAAGEATAGTTEEGKGGREGAGGAGALPFTPVGRSGGRGSRSRSVGCGVSTPRGAGYWVRPGKFGGRFPAVRRGAARWPPPGREVPALRGRLPPAVLLCRRAAPGVPRSRRAGAALRGSPRPPPLPVQGLRSAERAGCGRVTLGPAGASSSLVPRAVGCPAGSGGSRGNSPAEARALHLRWMGTRRWHPGLGRIGSLRVTSEAGHLHCHTLTTPPFIRSCFVLLFWSHTQGAWLSHLPRRDGCFLFLSKLIISQSIDSHKSARLLFRVPRCY